MAMTIDPFKMDRAPLRKMRAQVLSYAVIDIVKHYLSDDLIRKLSHELEERLEAMGAEVITDYTRHEAGLPPRGPDGWTWEEVEAIELRRLQVMQAPIVSPFSVMK